jgi:hypothetical protein
MGRFSLVDHETNLADHCATEVKNGTMLKDAETRINYGIHSSQNGRFRAG